MTASHYTPDQATPESIAMTEAIRTIVANIKPSARRRVREALFAASRRALPDPHKSPKVVSLRAASLAKARPDLYQRALTQHQVLDTFAELFSDVVDGVA